MSGCDEMTMTTPTLAQRAAAALAALEAALAEREERYEREQAVYRQSLALAAIERHGEWLGDARYDANAGLIVTDDGMAFHPSGYIDSPRLALVRRCAACNRALPDDDDNAWIGSLEDLGAALQRWQRHALLCDDCRDAAMPDSVGTPPSSRPVRDGWLYLPHTGLWINGTRILWVLRVAPAEYQITLDTAIPTDDPEHDVIHADDVAALVAWLEGRP